MWIFHNLSGFSSSSFIGLPYNLIFFFCATIDSQASKTAREKFTQEISFQSKDKDISLAKVYTHTFFPYFPKKPFLFTICVVLVIAVIIDPQGLSFSWILICVILIMPAVQACFLSVALMLPDILFSLRASSSLV